MPMEVRGLDELVRQLSNMEKKLGETGKEWYAIANKALTEAAEPVYDKINYNVHNHIGKKTGNLRKSISTSKVKQSVRRKGYRITIGVQGKKGLTLAPHAHLVEFGHAGPKAGSPPTPPHPFIRPAFDATIDEARAKMRDVLEEALDEALK